MRYSAVIFLACVICAGGCAVTKIHTMPVNKFSASYELVWDTTLKYLDKEKEPVVVSDKEKGIIATDWVNVHKLFGVRRYRYDIQIRRLGENNVEVGAASPQESYSMGDWEGVLPTERRAHRMFGFLKRELKRSLGISKLPKRPYSKRKIGLIKEE